MGTLRNRVLAVAVAALALAAVLGGSLGVAFAARQPLRAGVNPTVGGPLTGDVTPEKFMSCLPAGSWAALYVWDAANQSWRHYFNTNGTGVPSYVNNAGVGGLTAVPKWTGVAIVMNQAVQAPSFPNSQSGPCE